MGPDFTCGIMRTDETTLDYSIRLAQQIDNGMELTQKICFIGDSNMRDCFKSCSHYEVLKPYAHLFELHVKGGAKISQLREIFHKVAHFRFIIVGLGGNDLNSTAEDDMLKNLKNFLSHLLAKRPQQVVFFLQLFPGGDHLNKDNGAKLVKFNDMLRSNFPNEYHSISSWVSRCHLGETLQSIILIKNILVCSLKCCVSVVVTSFARHVLLTTAVILMIHFLTSKLLRQKKTYEKLLILFLQ